MRVLFVCPWMPGIYRPRALQILRHLAANHQVWFVGLYDDHEDQVTLRDIPLAGTTLVKASRVRSVVRALRAVPGQRSLQESYVADPQVQEAVRELVTSWQPDVIHMNVIRSRSYLPQNYTGPVVFDLDEIRSDFYLELSRGHYGLAKRLLGLIEAPRMQRAEAIATTRSDVVLFSSPSDLGRMGADNAHLVRTPQVVRPAGRAPRDANLLFVGRMCYGANIDAAIWFARHVLPLVRRQVPSTHLHIVGERPSRAVRRLEGPHVSVTGAVEDLGPYYSQASVAVVPVSAATGVQLKLIQALALGVPTVATPLGALRAGLQSGTHLLTAVGEIEWSCAVTTLLENQRLASSLAARAMAWAKDTYSEAALVNGLEVAYGKVAAAPRTEPDRTGDVPKFD